MDKVRELAYKKRHGFCMCSEQCDQRADQLHHMLPDTKVNRKKFPLFLNSIFNLCPVNHDCHMSKPLPRIYDHEASLYEEYLNGKPKNAR